MFGPVVARWRWAVVGVWAALALAGAVVGGSVFDRLSTVESTRPDAESAVAERQIDAILPEGPIIVAVIHGRHPYDEHLVAEVVAATEALRRLDGVDEVDDLYTTRGGRIGADNNSSLVRVELIEGLPPAEREAVEDRVVAGLHGIDAPRVLVGGEDLAQRAFGEQATRDAARGESIALVFLLAALVVIFGGVVAGSLPLAVALTAVAGTLLVLLGLSAVTEISEYAVNVVTLLGIGLAVDYALVLVARFREERAGGATPVEAVGTALATAGRAVLVSGLAVAAAMAGLAVFAEPLLAGMALGGAVVVVLATAVALTLVPALLLIAHRYVPPAGAETWVTRLTAGIPRPKLALLPRLARYAQARPAPVAAAVTVGLLLLAAPFLGANLANSDARALPRSMEARQAYDAVQAGFNNNRPAPVVALLQVDAAAPELRGYLNRLNQLVGVFRLELRPDVPAGWTIVDLTPRTGADAVPLVTAVRAVAAPFPVRVTGEAAELVDYRDSVAGRLPLAILVVVLATGLLLYALTGSLVVPVKALLLNALTMLASLGVLVVLFQWGWGAAVLGFEAWGALDLTTPLLLFVFIFGLSMDYEVFLLARIKEEYDRTGDNDRAVLAGITKTGRVVTAAAVCIGIVFLGFVLGDLVAVKEIGVGMAVAVLLDVTVVRGLLLPAVMTLLGDWNWWGRRHPPRPDFPRPRPPVEAARNAVR